MRDLIDRQAAINVILHYTLNPPYYMNEWAKRLIIAIKKDLMGDIEELPSAQQWIPVSERLPEDFEEVIITWVNRTPEDYFADIKDKPFTGAAVYFEGRWFWYSARCQDYLKEYGECYEDEMADWIEVIAWMPLPKPYKEGKHE